MEMIFDVQLDGSFHIKDYEPFLSRFYIWKQYKREISLHTLLNDGKKLEFSVDIKQSPSGVHYLEFIKDDSTHDIMDTRLVNVCACIEKIKFILNNGVVESIKIDIKTLNTKAGKLCVSLIESNNITLKQSLLEGLVKFYITINYQDRKMT